MARFIALFTVLVVGRLTLGVAQSSAAGEFFERFTAEWVRRDPAFSTSARYFSGEEQSALDRRLTPETSEHTRGTVELARRGLRELSQLDRNRMTDVERVSADQMRWQLEVIVEGEQFADYEWPLNQFNGANVRLPNLMTVVHPIRNEAEARNYLARLGEMGGRMDEATRESTARASRGLIPPAFILRSTIAQMQQFVAPEPRQNPLITTFVQRLTPLVAIPASLKEQLTADAAALVARDVYPAWLNAIAALERQLPRATEDAGLWRFKDGAEAYAYNLKRYTTTSMTAAAIHELGRREVSRIENEMDAIFRQLGRSTGTVTQRIQALDRELRYPETDEGRRQIMTDIDVMIRDAEKRAASLFDRRPRARVIAQPYPEFRWASAAASYSPPPLDGSRPGIYQMPLRTEYLTRFGLRTLVYHETVPGHHFQVALSVENPNLPRFRQVRALGGMSAVTEGWALYAERLAAEEGWYEGDPEGRLGALEAELFRARRLVVDTGLHAMRWTRQQAIDFGIEPSEVERYVVFPGQACSYKVGQLEIIRLRDKARAALGDRFNPREFHNVVLDTGIVPLAILERSIDTYIARSRPGDTRGTVR
jgi:uncharacterized protein (DUF885 family)